MKTHYFDGLQPFYYFYSKNATRMCINWTNGAHKLKTVFIHETQLLESLLTIIYSIKLDKIYNSQIHLDDEQLTADLIRIDVSFGYLVD